MKTVELTRELMQVLDSVEKKYGSSTIVEIRTDDYGVIVRDVVTNKIVYDADTLAEFTYGFHEEKA